MELENQAARQAYIKLLTDTLTKKSEVLRKLLELTKQQDNLGASDNFNEDEFLQIVTLKEEQINSLSKLDDGFEQLFGSIKEELFNNKEKYKNEITRLKELIVIITDINVELQALEKRNKAHMEAYFSMKRKEIRNSRASNKTVTDYYKTMTKQQETQSFFYDKKK